MKVAIITTMLVYSLKVEFSPNKKSGQYNNHNNKTKHVKSMNTLVFTHLAQLHLLINGNYISNSL